MTPTSSCFQGANNLVEMADRGREGRKGGKREKENILEERIKDRGWGQACAIDQWGWRGGENLRAVIDAGKAIQGPDHMEG